MACDIICPEKKKLFEGASLSANSVASRITESVTNVQQQLIVAVKVIVAYSIALLEEAIWFNRHRILCRYHLWQ
jgi:hypothetical protein